MNHEEVIKLLGAYLDGELDLAACVRIEEHLDGCAECMQSLEAECELVEIVKSESPRFEASPFLKTRIRAELREKSGTARGPIWRMTLIPWMGLAVLAIVAFLWPRNPPQLINEIVANHVRSLMVNHLMDVASTDQHTVKPWFAGKLDFSPQVIDLTGSGYQLIGGRLDVLNGQTVAAIIYGRRKHYINLFVWPEDGRALPGHLYTENGYHVLAWKRGGMDYAAVSELGEQEFRDFVKLIEDRTVETRLGE